MQYPDFVIHCADNGRSGLECFRLHSPHIVLTDVSMPVLDGISMSAEIKSLNPEAGPGAKLVNKGATFFFTLPSQ